jgi:hypothetical protein
MLGGDTLVVLGAMQAGTIVVQAAASGKRQSTWAKYTKINCTPSASKQELCVTTFHRIDPRFMFHTRIGCLQASSTRLTSKTTVTMPLAESAPHYYLSTNRAPANNIIFQLPAFLLPQHLFKVFYISKVCAFPSAGTSATNIRSSYQVEYVGQ